MPILAKRGIGLLANRSGARAERWRVGLLGFERERYSDAMEPARPHDKRTEVSTATDDLGLNDFERGPGDQGLSLEELSRAYADLLRQGAEPYADAAEVPVEHSVSGETAEDASGTPIAGHDIADPDECCEISPRSILEAILFVGHPDSEPLTSRHVASLMRGVRPVEIDELVAELNELYASEGRPYQIVSAGDGYRLELREQFSALRDRYHGRLREAKLSQAAIDVLSIVAYQPGVGRDEIDRLRAKSSAAAVAQLVRRGLLRIERAADRPHKPRYFTTERFLDLFGLQSLEDLPKGQESDRRL